MADTTRFKITYYDSHRAGRLAVMTMDNGADYKKPNFFGQDALASLHAALDELDAQTDVAGLMVTGKPFVFAAGADINSFVGVTPEFATVAARAGHEAFGRLAGLDMPTLAAINGVCLGGGLEIALHCDYRTISDAAAAVAFPEVFLSIFPAWGGTQLAPRLVGAEQALHVIVHNAIDNNKMMRPAEVVQRGFADRLIPAVDFYDASVALLERVVAGEETIDRPDHDDTNLDEVLAAARQAADARTHGATPAPYTAIELVEFAARGGDLAEGREREIAKLGELLPSRQAQAAVYSFDLTQRRVKKQPGKPDVPARSMTKIGVVGSGLMGAQLGSLFLQRLEVPLVMKDIDQGVLDQAKSTIEADLDKRVQRGRLVQPRADYLKSLVTYTLDYEPLAGADFVIEAVVEVLDLKKKIFADIEQVVDEGAILATNTSSLSVSAMAADLAHPERVVGFHFFNPVAILPLLEVVRAEQTNDVTLSTAFDVAKNLRKSAVACADTPAFVVNRILTRFMLACGQAVRAGNDFAEVDDAVKQLGLPMGPFELLGLVGFQVAAHVAETMHHAYPDRFPLDPNFQMLAESGLPAVYDWSKGREPYPQVVEGWQRDPDAQPLDADGIRTAAIEAVADEIAAMLDEGVVADARDIDTCMLLGAGWPFFNGGICLYLDQTGVTQRLFGRRFVGREDRTLAAGAR